MKIFIFIGMTLVVLLLQFYVAPQLGQHLYFNYSFDTKLAEPDEKITFLGRLINTWTFPITYINLGEAMPEGAAIEGKKKNIISFSLFLLMHKSFRHTVLFSLPKRGVYKGGKYYIETGDYLGFKSYVSSGQIEAEIVVMPKLSDDEIVLKILGGYLGEISVKRFIMEDPMLSIGYFDYTGREPMKKISWNHSAKVGKLMVKRSDYTVDANAAVVLNMASGSNEEKEKSFEIVRTVCEGLEREHIPYQFLSNGDAGNLEEGYGKMHLNQLMTNLGRSKLYGYSTLDDLIERCIRERKRSRSYFVISAPMSAEDKKALIRLQKYSDYKICVLEAEVNQDAVC